jgi:hypothetical protein
VQARDGLLQRQAGRGRDWGAACLQQQQLTRTACLGEAMQERWMYPSAAECCLDPLSMPLPACLPCCHPALPAVAEPSSGPPG